MTQRWIVFDLDGTLIESEQIWRDVRHAFVIKHDGRWRDDAQTKMMGMRTEEWARYLHDELSVALLPNDIAKEVVNIVKRHVAESMPIIPGASEALERLAPLFCLGVATSAALPVAQTVLKETGWQRYFSVVVSADEVRRGKPAPDVYLRALDLMKADPRRTAAIEDSANGIRAARAANLAVVAVPNRAFPPNRDDLSFATRVVKSVGDLDVATIDDVLNTRRERLAPS